MAYDTQTVFHDPCPSIFKPGYAHNLFNYFSCIVDHTLGKDRDCSNTVAFFYMLQACSYNVQHTVSSFLCKLTCKPKNLAACFFQAFERDASACGDKDRDIREL